ncbi:MAG: SHOCT domain-containing protein [Deltaproteobacteria bacterium]|nr:MAG: SHOCT domain-containing protein [Deltaproteobacteria bacterium]
MYGNGMMDGMPMMGGFGWIFMLLFWGLVIAAIVYVVKRLGNKDSPGDGGAGQTPLDILKIRYARGEISEKDFTRMKKGLE